MQESFFTLLEGESDLWKCWCGTIRRQTSSRYSNLVSHVEKKHPDRLKELKEVANADSQTSSSRSNFGPESSAPFFYTPQALKAHFWLDLSISGLLPFSIVESDVYRKNVKYPPIDRKSLMKYMSLITKEVE